MSYNPHLIMQKIEGRGIGNFKEWRRNFGPGVAGRRAFRLITGQTDCEIRSGCNSRAIETVDYDVLGELELKASCGGGHSFLIKKDIEDDLVSIGRNTVFGKNGWGRA